MARPKKELRKEELSRESGERVAIIHLKGSQAYAEWLDGVHRKTHIPKTTIFRLALEEWAERNGYSKPPDL